ncbi:hypothetical protein [Corallococcus macrosporus]|uniref:Uncharacterized protein n=1 Tax=Myxococcus fulvus (strain ATCC BAA-855 / HW-1) TaxID=483219 RepID=F8CH46_MYXFH|nr:hypothetical protein [Corallococcus macrosporus]AEI64963.1 hypothetical protein LILAB_15300 [Corallococcus macrosporus]
MPLYYVQNFTYDGPGSSKMYGAMGAHNHDQANQFTTDCIAYLKQVGCVNVKETGSFASNQAEPLQGKEMRWDVLQSKWVKA